MGYNKRKTPPIIAATQARITGLKSIDPALTLGEGLAVADGQKLLKDHAEATEKYNLLLGQADDALNGLKKQEKEMQDWNKRTLSGVSSKFGDDSSQYELAGGTRRSERQKPAPRAKKSSL